MLTLTLGNVLVPCASGQATDKPLPPADAPVEATRATEALLEPPAPVSVEPKRIPRWTTVLGVAGGYDSNVDLAPVEVGRGDASGQLTAAGTARFVRRSWELDLEGTGSGVFYAQLTGYNAVPYAGTVRAGGRLGRRATLATRAGYQRDYTRNALNLADAALVAGRTLRSTFAGGIELQYALAPRLALVSDAVYEHVTFASSAPGGDTLRVNAGASWRARERDRLTLRWHNEQTRSTSDRGSSNEGRLLWQHELAPGLEGALGAGLGRAQLLTAEQAGRVSFGSAEARIAFRRGRHALGASYEHSLQQAYGLGQSLLFDTLTLDEGYAFTPRLDFVLRGSASRGEDPTGTPFRIEGQSASAGLALRLSLRAVAKASYSYWRRQETGGRVVGSHVLELTLQSNRSSRTFVGEGS